MFEVCTAGKYHSSKRNNKPHTPILVQIILQICNKRQMELIFLDPGLLNKAGHSYKLAKAVSQKLDRRNLRHRVFGLHRLDASITAEIGAIPHFSRSLYDGEDFSWLEKRLRAV